MTEQPKALIEVLEQAPTKSIAFFDSTGLFKFGRLEKKDSGSWEDTNTRGLFSSTGLLAEEEKSLCTIITPDNKRIWPLTIHVHVTEPEPQPKEYESARLADEDTIFISSTRHNRIKTVGGDWTNRNGYRINNADIQSLLDNNEGILILLEEYKVVKQVLEAYRNQK